MPIRDADANDRDLLTNLLVEAVNWTGEERMTRAQILADPACSHYVTGWPRPGDVGVVAVVNDHTVGAAWARFFRGADKGYGYVADDIPELSMGVRPEYRGQGLGGQLLRAVLDRVAAHGCHAISLSVEDGNAIARRLYESHGFTVVGREGGSDVMLRHLDG